MNSEFGIRNSELPLTAPLSEGIRVQEWREDFLKTVGGLLRARQTGATAEMISNFGFRISDFPPTLPLSEGIRVQEWREDFLKTVGGSFTARTANPTVVAGRKLPTYRPFRNSEFRIPNSEFDARLEGAS